LKIGVVCQTGYQDYSTFGDCQSDQSTWAKQQVNVFLPQLYQNLSGSNIQWRTNQVRAGGDYERNWTLPENGEFLSTRGQLEILNANPYLTVFSSPYTAAPYQNDNNTFLVHYFYPDPLHLSDQIRTSLPAELQSRLKTSYGPDDQSAFEQDTADIIESLLLNVFMKYFGEEVHEDSIVRLILDLISIHPCYDFNGRTTRFYGIVASMESNLDFFIPFLSDFDVVTPIPAYRHHLIESTTSATILKLSMMFEAVTAVIHDRSPQYNSLPEWKQFIELSLDEFQGEVPYTFSSTFSHSENELIRQRKFIELFDGWFGLNWSTRN
jgi:hypothetical protein